MPSRRTNRKLNDLGKLIYRQMKVLEMEHWKDVAGKVGIAHTTLSAWIYEPLPGEPQAKPSFENIEPLAKAINAPPSWVLKAMGIEFPELEDKDPLVQYVTHVLNMLSDEGREEAAALLRFRVLREQAKLESEREPVAETQATN